ncbi:MAG: Gfo/Idh/MocA family oxidoreductase [Pseudomonadota bacterium]
MKKAALIGLGMVAETHLAALRDAPDVSLHGVLARDPAKARTFALAASEQSGQPVSAYGDLAQLVADGDVDFVILATPPDARLTYVKALVEARKPILMEKPIERTFAAAEELVALCTHANIPLGVVFQHRARAASRALKEALDIGKLGEIVTAEVRVPWWRDQSYYDVPGRGTRARDGGGVMITQAIHTLDLLLWLLGPIQRLQAMMHKTLIHLMEAEDWAGAIFETTSGCMGTLLATTAAYPGRSETITLHGTKATAHLDAGTLTLSFRDGRVDTIGEATATGGGADPMAFTHAWHQSVIEDFAASLDGKRPPLAPGRDALWSHAVIDAMERSSGQDNWTEVASL